MNESRFRGRQFVCTGPKRVLAVTPSEEDQTRLQGILCEWEIRRARTCEQARTVLNDESIILIVCERELPDGNWKDLLDYLSPRHAAPLLIVFSQLADDALWAEVLNLGGHDVLPKPLDDREVLWSVRMAWEHWSEQQQLSSAAAVA